MSYPNRKYENQCFQKGYRFVAGLDEVGMGCLAGPVVAAAVVLNNEDVPKGLNDSKRLGAATREKLSQEIRNRALCFGIGTASVEEIDLINIYQAARLAMVRALAQLNQQPDFLLIDGRGRVESALPQMAIVGGDRLSVSIAAASIVAKVFRDEMMERFEDEFPGYGFAKHKGYGTKAHRQRLEAQGPCILHRKSFSWTPVREDSAAPLPQTEISDLENESSLKSR